MKNISKIFEGALEAFAKSMNSSSNKNMPSDDVRVVRSAIWTIQNFKKVSISMAIMFLVYYGAFFGLRLRHVYIFFNAGQLTLFIGMLIIQLYFFKTVCLFSDFNFY